MLYCICLGINGSLSSSGVSSNDIPQYEHATNQTIPIYSSIVGYWIEDHNLRDNIDAFLREFGAEVFSSDYTPSNDWEDEKVIYVDDDLLTINELRGPSATPYQFRVKFDNDTHAEIDIGVLGGVTNATTEMTDDSFISYVLKPWTSELLFTLTHKIECDDIDTLIVEREHFESSIVWTSVFKRQYAED